MTVAHEAVHLEQFDRAAKGETPDLSPEEAEAKADRGEPGGASDAPILYEQGSPGEEGGPPLERVAEALARWTSISATTWSWFLPLLPASAVGALWTAAQLEGLYDDAVAAKDRFVTTTREILADLTESTQDQLREAGMPDWVVDTLLPLLVHITTAVVAAVPGVLLGLFLDIVAPWWGVFTEDLPKVYSGLKRAGSAVWNLDLAEGQAAATELEQSVLSAVGRFELALAVWLLIIGTLGGTAVGATAGGAGAGVATVGAGAAPGAAGGGAAGGGTAGGGVYAAMEALGVVLLVTQIASDLKAVVGSVLAWLYEDEETRSAGYLQDAILGGVRLGATVLMLLVAFAAIRVGQAVGKIARAVLDTKAAKDLMPNVSAQLAEWFGRGGAAQVAAKGSRQSAIQKTLSIDGRERKLTAALLPDGKRKLYLCTNPCPELLAQIRFAKQNASASDRAALEGLEKQVQALEASDLGDEAIEGLLAPIRQQLEGFNGSRLDWTSAGPVRAGQIDHAARIEAATALDGTKVDYGNPPPGYGFRGSANVPYRESGNVGRGYPKLTIRDKPPPPVYQVGAPTGPGEHLVGRTAASNPAHRLDQVPPVDEFPAWFNGLSEAEFGEVWADRYMRDVIETRLRSPGGYHEWFMVSRADKFQAWGVSPQEIWRFRTRTTELTWTVPDTGLPGSHGKVGSGQFHLELGLLIDKATTLAGLRAEIVKLAARWKVPNLPPIVP